MHVQVIDVHIMFQQDFVSHNPPRHPYPPDTERGAISISRGAVLLGHACVGASHQPIPHQAGWDLQRAPYKKRSCLPCDASFVKWVCLKIVYP